MHDHLNIITKLVQINRDKNDVELVKLISQAIIGIINKPLDKIIIDIKRTKKQISILPGNLYTATVLAIMIQNNRENKFIHYPTTWSGKKTTGYAFKYGNFVWEKSKNFILEYI